MNALFRDDLLFFSRRLSFIYSLFRIFAAKLQQIMSPVFRGKTNTRSRYTPARPMDALLAKNEEERMYIHVICGGHEAKYWLEPCVELAKSMGIPEHKLSEIKNIAEKYPTIRNARAGSRGRGCRCGFSSLRLSPKITSLQLSRSCCLF